MQGTVLAVLLSALYQRNLDRYDQQAPHTEAQGMPRTACVQVLRKLRRLPWAEQEGYVVKCMLASAKGRYTDLPLVASLAAGLARYHPSLGVALPDALLEQVHGTLNPNLNPRSHETCPSLGQGSWHRLHAAV